MFRRILPFAIRNFPQLLRVSALTFGLLVLKGARIDQPIQCFNLKPWHETNIFPEVLPKIVRIEHNGEIVGYGYCFNDRLIVSPSHELSQKKARSNKYQFFMGDKKIECNFKILGSFDILTFIQADNNILPALPAKQVNLYTPIHVVQQRSFLSIKDGYYVANDSGYGVINAKGQVGSLVLNNSGVVGIVSHIGRDADDGFLRVMMWKDINNIMHRLKTHKSGSLYLGISVVATGQKGVSVVRVAPNSPLSNMVQMGDTVLKVNEQTIKNPDDLVRIIMMSQPKVTLEIEGSDQSTKNVTVQL